MTAEVEYPGAYCGGEVKLIKLWKHPSDPGSDLFCLVIDQPNYRKVSIAIPATLLDSIASLIEKLDGITETVSDPMDLANA